MTLIPGPAPMEAMPIDEASIVAGSPRGATATLYTTPDGRATVGLFTCTPGTFRYTLETDEVTHLLAGHVVVTPDGADPIEARAGDTFVLPAGTPMLVEVREAISDVYVSWSAA